MMLWVMTMSVGSICLLRAIDLYSMPKYDFLMANQALFCRGLISSVYQRHCFVASLTQQVAFQERPLVVGLEPARMQAYD